MARRTRSLVRHEPTDAEKSELHRRELERDARANDLFVERRARPPLPYASTLARITCFCHRVHDTRAVGIDCECGRIHNQGVIDCECGRRWTPIERPRSSPFYR